MGEPGYQIRPYVLDSAFAAHHHGGFDFVTEDVQHVGYALLSGVAQPPEERPAEHDRLRSEGYGFDDIGAPAYAAVEVDLNVVARGLRDFGEGLDGGDGGVEVAPSVVGDDKGVNAVLRAERLRPPR